MPTPHTDTSTSSEPRSSDGAAVELDAVTRRYRIDDDTSITAVDNVTLSIDPGAIVALTGSSGSGKSTLLHLINAIDIPDAGRVLVDGTDLASLSRRHAADYRRSIGFVFQRFNLLPALTLADNVISPVLPYRVDYNKQKRAAELLAAVGLTGRENSLPSRLSGGQQQRVAIARALINQPRLLLADEPTGNLDSQTSGEILDLLIDIHHQHTMTIMIATHDPATAARAQQHLHLCDGHLTDPTPTDRPPAEL